MVISVAKIKWFVSVHVGRMLTALGWVVARISCCGASLRKANRERSNKDDLCHFKLSIAQCGILQYSDFIVGQSRRHDSIHPKQEAGAKDHVVQDDLLDQAKDFAEREHNIDSLVALAEALYAIDFAPS